jgi:oxygen-dependent protoporphyrinogen oxidase
LRPVVFEKSNRLGGAIQTTHIGGWLHESGPNSLLEGPAEIEAFVDELGLGRRRLYAAPEAKQRYIIRDGRLVAMPTSPFAFARTRLFSPRAKLSLLGEPWRRRPTAVDEESVASFVRRRLGQEFLDYAINPFVGGVYAGDPERLSVRHAFPKLDALERRHGSLIRGALARRNHSGGPGGRIYSFPQGLGELPAAVAAALVGSVRLGTDVTAIRRLEHGWEVDSIGSNESRIDDFEAVVCALPAAGLADLEIEGAPTASRLAVLREIEHPPVASVFTGYRAADMQHPLDGFGMLMPQVEHGFVLGTLFSSTLFPDRAPRDHVALTTFVGGMREPELVGLDDRELLRLVQGELTRLLGVSAPPVFTQVRRCLRAIPQYTLGYQRYKDAIAATEAALPGLFIGGNCRDGISLPNCIASGQRLATAVESFALTHRAAIAAT